MTIHNYQTGNIYKVVVFITKSKIKVTLYESIHICTSRYYATFGVANGLLAESEKVTNFPPLKKIKTIIHEYVTFDYSILEVKHYS